MEGAGVGIRALSTIVDGILLAVIGGAVAAALGGAHYLWSLVIGFCYYTYFESSYGATPGKMLCGLKVVKADGSACDLRSAAVRTACRLIDGLFFYFIGAVLIWTSVNNQRLGDRLAATLVIRVL